jgi:ADP-ribosylglycohydrolase
LVQSGSAAESLQFKVRKIMKEKGIRKKMKRVVSERFLYEKILGCLSMVAIGDALGMPAHDMTREEIQERFGKPIDSFRAPFGDSRVHRSLQAGQITDDTRLTLAMAKAYIENNGKITSSLITRYIAAAVNEAFQEGLETLFGMSTKQALKAFNDGQDPIETGLREKSPLIGATNGGAMRISPVGLVHPGDICSAVQDAAAACLSTHPTQAAISAACAVAAGVAEAMTSQATVFSIVKASLSGAEQGEMIGRKMARTVPVPSVPMRIRLAVSLALKSKTREEAGEQFIEIIGAGLPAYESIPTAIGIFLVCEGDPEECVKSGANIGNDTDTISSMAGALAGAFKGFTSVPAKWYQTIEKVNHLHLAATAKQLTRIALGNLDHGK